MSILSEKVYEFMQRNSMNIKARDIVIGLSGGADSIFLAVIIMELSDKLGISAERIHAVHINHMLRGTEADADERFVAEFCMEKGIDFISCGEDIRSYASETGKTVEEAGREFRYKCFYDISNLYDKCPIAVAHNKNDLAETVIFNMVRGSGIKGMAGIPPVRDRIIRPLLETSREEIEGYLDEINQDYCTDSTNFEKDYDRNKVRHIILPELTNINERAVDHICRLAYEAAETSDYIRERANAISGDEQEGVVTFEIKELHSLEDILMKQVIYEAICKVAGYKKDITSKHVELVVELIGLDTGKQINLPYQVRAYRSYDRLVISRDTDEDKTFDIDITKSGDYSIPNWGIIQINYSKVENYSTLEKKIYTKVVDYDKIYDTLCVRTPREDDYIVIDTNGSRKKLTRLFIDKKIDRAKRASWPVVACGQEIVWVIGLRYNEAYRVDNNTRNVICFNYIGKGEGNGEDKRTY